MHCLPDFLLDDCVFGIIVLVYFDKQTDAGLGVAESKSFVDDFGPRLDIELQWSSAGILAITVDQDIIFSPLHCKVPTSRWILDEDVVGSVRCIALLP